MQRRIDRIWGYFVLAAKKEYCQKISSLSEVLQRGCPQFWKEIIFCKEIQGPTLYL
jgi:hypothetical protein